MPHNSMLGIPNNAGTDTTKNLHVATLSLCLNITAHTQSITQYLNYYIVLTLLHSSMLHAMLYY